MKKRFSTKQLTTTALLLALCIVFQSLKGLSVYLTGSAVNCILIIATLYCGILSGTFIALVTPIVAYFIGATPIVNLVPLMMPVIMIGNELLVLASWSFRKKLLPLGLVIGCILKAVFLWLTVWYAILPFFGTHLKQPMVEVVKVNFSLTQFITAYIGSILAFIIYKKGIKFYENIGNR